MSLVLAPPSMSNTLASRENNLNALRLIAALLVLFSHCYPLSGNIQSEPIAAYLHVFDGGALAVLAFFFLSGYLISSSWTSSPHFPAFMAKRALRILPGLAVVAIICALLLGPIMTSLSWGQYFRSSEVWKYIRDNINVFSLKTNVLPGVFENLPLAHGINGSLWTLKVEVLVYIATGLLGATCLLPTARKRFSVVLFSAVMLYIAARLTSLSKESWEALHLPVQLFFSCQLVAAYLLGSVAFVIRDWLIRSWLLLAALAGLAWLSSGTHLFYFCIYISYGYFLLMVATSPIRLLGSAIRKHDYSYGIYIYAFPIQQTLVALMPGISPVMLFLTAFPVVTLFAAASWHWIEKPALHLKNYPLWVKPRPSPSL